MQSRKETIDIDLNTKLKPSIKERLSPVVLDIFANGDFHQVNMREIAQKAGVGYATIYRHFKSKDQLLFWFVDYWLSDFVDRIIDHLQGLEEIKERIRKIVWLQLDFYNRNPNVGRIIMMTIPLKTWMQDKTYRQEKLMKLLMEVFQEGQVKKILDPVLPTRFLMDVLLGMIGRTVVMWIYRDQQGELTDQAGTLFEMIWRAIRNPKTSE
ncbi:MAG: TetR/AcrR family transcriptional regulator [Desulfobacteraceae bacterium]|nr:TetR/AcrR family transcriptional regulator [Desulfobacteraceae bacterium]